MILFYLREYEGLWNNEIIGIKFSSAWLETIYKFNYLGFYIIGLMGFFK